MIIVLGRSKQEDFHRPEKPHGKTREIDNEARISKKAEIKRKFNRNQKRIRPWDIQLSFLIFLVTKMLKKINLYVYFSRKWMHIEKTLMKLSICFFDKDDKLLENTMKFGENVRIVSKKNLTINQYTMKNI